MKNRTTEEVGNIVKSEGLGYAIQNYLGAGKIQDKELSKLWKDAELALNAVEKYLENALGEDFSTKIFNRRK